MSELITHKELLEYLHYNHETGIFTWKKNVSSTTRVGDIAGSKLKNMEKHDLICIRQKRYLYHRLVWFYVYRKWPKYEIDHIDGNVKNNRISNLRDVPHHINMKNNKLQKNNKSGIHGVRWKDANKKWAVSLTNNKKVIHLGTYDDFFEACCVRKSAESKYGFHENHGRRNPIIAKGVE